MVIPNETLYSERRGLAVLRIYLLRASRAGDKHSHDEHRRVALEAWSALFGRYHCEVRFRTPPRGDD